MTDSGFTRPSASLLATGMSRAAAPEAKTATSDAATSEPASGARYDDFMMEFSRKETDGLRFRRADDTQQGRGPPVWGGGPGLRRRFQIAVSSDYRPRPFPSLIGRRPQLL